jgi:hypothetical protein
MYSNKQPKSRLDELLQDFDKAYIREIFAELARQPNLHPDEKDNICYDDNGWRYFIFRRHLTQIPMSHGGLGLG